MANSLYQALNGNANTNSIGNMGNFMARLQQFQQTMQGDPRATVQQMLNTGQINQQQFNQAAQMATQIQRMIGK